MTEKETRQPPGEPREILARLCALPHRGVGTPQAAAAAKLLRETLSGWGAQVDTQRFACPKTYLPIVWWIAGAQAAALLAAGSWPWAAFWVAAAFALAGAAHFDWRRTPLTRMVPQVPAENLIARGKNPPGAARRRVVLMAHYDTAPVSLLYRPSLVAGFRRSLLIGIGLMLLSPLLILAQAAGTPFAPPGWSRWALAAYFGLQAVLSSVDYFRFGFTNGAADNASGVAAAMEVARRLWEAPLPDTEVELVLTSGEEVAMVGARAYLAENAAALSAPGVHVLNFDNLGCGALRIITETGSLTAVRYRGPLAAAAQAAAGEPRFAGVKTAAWHTGDFDSLWFARAGISSLTLSAQDAGGLIPHLHRPEDTAEKVDPALLSQAVDFALETLRRL